MKKNEEVSFPSQLFFSSNTKNRRKRERQRERESDVLCFACVNRRGGQDHFLEDKHIDRLNEEMIAWTTLVLLRLCFFKFSVLKMVVVVIMTFESKVKENKVKIKRINTENFHFVKSLTGDAQCHSWIFAWEILQCGSYFSSSFSLIGVAKIRFD